MLKALQFTLKCFCNGLFFVKLLVFKNQFWYFSEFFKFFEIFWMGYQANDATFISHTAGTTCTVSVGFTVSRDIEVDDHFQILNIDASCQEVST